MATFNEDIVGGRGGYGFGGFGDGGGLGIIALLALMRGGWGGGWGAGDGDGVSALNNVQGAVDTAAIMSNLADIKAAVPLSEAQVQLALQGVQSTLSSQANNDTQHILAGQSTLGLALANATNSLTRDIAAVDTNVDRQSTAIQMAIKEDGEKTRALITQNTIVDLQRQLGVAEATAARNEQIAREQTNSHNITMTVNQAQAQTQQQLQQQQWLLNSLLGGFGQLARAANSNVIVGSTGAVTGAQNANPTNVVA